MSERLKKVRAIPWETCPHCGGVGEKGILKSEGGISYYYIRFRDCGAATEMQRYLSDAIMRWDRRINTENRRGIWLFERCEGDRDIMNCSVCGNQLECADGQRLPKFCGECGARMIHQLQMGRRFSAADTMEIYYRVYLKKRAEARKEELNALRMQEMAEEALQKQNGSDNEAEKQS